MSWRCHPRRPPRRSRSPSPSRSCYEDADLIVLDKPAGLVVHPAPGNPDGTLVNALLAHCGAATLTGIGDERRPGIVHRLDKDTSGVMVVAKTQPANDGSTAAFAARDLDRAYLALVWGLPSPMAGEIEGAIGRDKRDRKRMAVVTRGGKAALTRYRMLRAWQTCRGIAGVPPGHRANPSNSRPSGRRGHPFVGDPLYLRRIPAVARVAAERRFAIACWISPARRCTPHGWVSSTRAPASRFSSNTAPPPDMAEP